MEDRKTGARMRHRSKWYRLLAELAAITAVAGCATPAPPVEPIERPSAGSAYVYGHFSLVVRGDHGLSTSEKVGLLIDCTNNERYMIWFSKQDAFRLMKIKPSHCTLARYVFASQSGRPVHSISTKHPKAVDFTAGEGHYIGDFEMTVKNKSNFFFGAKTDFAATASNRYDYATRKLKDMYPNFVDYPTQNQYVPAIP